MLKDRSAEESGKMHSNVEHAYFLGLRIGPRHRTATNGKENRLVTRLCCLYVNQITGFHEIWCKCRWRLPLPRTFKFPTVGINKIADAWTCKIGETLTQSESVFKFIFPLIIIIIIITTTTTTTTTITTTTETTITTWTQHSYNRNQRKITDSSSTWSYHYLLTSQTRKFSHLFHN
jgi:hypothetical protein